MIKTMMLASGYAIGLGVEISIIVIAALLIVLALANVLFRKGEKTEKEPEVALVEVGVVNSGEPVAVVADEEPAVTVIKEIDTVYVPVATTAEATVEDAEPDETQKGETVAEEEPVRETEGGKTPSGTSQPIIINVYNGGAGDGTQKGETAESATHTVEETPVEENTKTMVEVDDGETIIKVKESKTIEELYAELSVEQKSFFDELKEKALKKPQAVLSVTKNYESVKIGKKSILKLIIRKGVTVAEFLLESDLLKEYRKTSTNKLGKSKIRIRPTVIAVTELATLKTALDMIDLAYEQVIDV